MAVLGEFIPVPSDGGPYYTPWFPRGGNQMTVTFEVISLVGAGVSVDVLVQTKNSEESDDVGNASNMGTLNAAATGAHTFNAGQLLSSANPSLHELVRYKVTVNGNAGDGVFMRFQNPSWLDN